jgi:sugar lactone lactonase YvrE
MMKRYFACALIMTMIWGCAKLWAQKIETVDGVRVVHNEKGGQWGKTPKVALELVRKIGDIDSDDENLSFNQPGDVAMDTRGNIYILDSANARIQKFGADGKFLASIGRKGQGPGEYMMPDSIDFDAAGRLIVYDPFQLRIQAFTGDGKETKITTLQGMRVTNLRCWTAGTYLTKGSLFTMPQRKGEEAKQPKLTLFKAYGPDGKLAREFGTLVDLGDSMTSSMGNGIAYAVDSQGGVSAVYIFQNRLDQYSADGELLWRADRPMNFPTEVKKKAKMETSEGKVISMTAPEMNTCAVAVAVDRKGRIWVVTDSRQLKKEEQIQQMMTSWSGPGGGISSIKSEVKGNTDVRKTDALKLEVFAPDGILLGEIPLTHFVDHARICGDYLFLIDANRGAAVYQYKIVEK